jgi:hypothetical protein
MTFKSKIKDVPCLTAPMRSWIRLTVLVSLSGIPSASWSDDPTLSKGREELQKAVEALRPRPNSDNTPVEFSVGTVKYRMPRNYLITMSNWNGGPQELVTMRLSFPDLAPITEATRRCVTGPSLWGHLPCEYVDLRIGGSGGVTAQQAFENMKSLYRNTRPINAPFGYEKYEIGPEESRTEVYRKVEGDQIFCVQLPH